MFPEQQFGLEVLGVQAKPAHLVALEERLVLFRRTIVGARQDIAYPPGDFGWCHGSGCSRMSGCAGCGIRIFAGEANRLLFIVCEIPIYVAPARGGAHCETIVGSREPAKFAVGQRVRYGLPRRRR
jgi:hypothetical protein